MLVKVQSAFITYDAYVNLAIVTIYSFSKHVEKRHRQEVNQSCLNSNWRIQELVQANNKLQQNKF